MPRDDLPRKPPVPKQEFPVKDQVVIPMYTRGEDIEFEKFTKHLTNDYLEDNTYDSISMDLIALYVKGQKFLYVESKTFCERRLYYLMLPAILMSTICTVMATLIKQYMFVVSILTAINSFILAVVTYLKLDAKAEAHKITAYHFEKLQTECEFYSGKVLMIKDQGVGKKSINEFVDNLEQKINEIKESNQFIIPELIRLRFQKIYSYNVFSMVKKYKTEHLQYMQQLVHVNALLKKIREGSVELTGIDYEPPQTKQTKTVLAAAAASLSINNNEPIRIESELYEENLYHTTKMTEKELLRTRDILIRKIIEYRNFSHKMNKEYEDEIERYNSLRKRSDFCIKWCPDIMGCLKT